MALERVGSKVLRRDLEPGTLAIARGLSANAKLGDAATTYAAQASCPSACVFRDGGGCYAESGQVGKFVTDPLNRAAGDPTPVEVANAEAEAIDALPQGTGRPLRLHTVGDSPTDECARIVAAAGERYMARGGGPVWTYTHAWRDVSRASWGPVSVLASCETAQDVLEAQERGYATAVVVEDFPSARLYGSTIGDVLPCPAQTRHRTCTDCRLCMDDAGVRARGYSIGFEVHGVPYAVRMARLALQDPDDPDRRVPSEERIRVIRLRLIEDLGREPTVREVSVEIPGLNGSSIAQWLRFHRGEIIHPAERRRARRAA